MKATLEKIPMGPESNICAFTYERPHFDAPWHFHPELELTYILKSEGIRYVGNHISPFKAGDLVMIGPGIPHCWKNGRSYTGGSEALVIQWGAPVVGELSEFARIHELMAKANKGIRFHEQTARHVLPRLEEVVEKKGFDGYLAFISLLHTLAGEAEVEYLSSFNYRENPSDETTRRISLINQYILEHYTTHITLASVASLVHMSEESFSRFFSQTMRKPFFSYLNEYRINVAATLLLETDLPVAQVGFSAGYESLPFFYKQFRKYKGCSPLVFRRSLMG